MLSIKNLTKTTMAEVAKGAIGLNPEQLHMGEQRRIGAILRRLGWRAERDRRDRWWELDKSATRHG